MKFLHQCDETLPEWRVIPALFGVVWIAVGVSYYEAGLILGAGVAGIASVWFAVSWWFGHPWGQKHKRDNT